MNDRRVSLTLDGDKVSAVGASPRSIHSIATAVEALRAGGTTTHDAMAQAIVDADEWDRLFQFIKDYAGVRL